MTYPNKREVQFQFFVHLFGRIRRHSVRNAYFHRRNSAMNMLWKNRGFDLNVISKQMDTQRMSLN